MILPTKGHAEATASSATNPTRLFSEQNSAAAAAHDHRFTAELASGSMRSERTGMIFRGLLVTALLVGVLGFFRHPAGEIDPGSPDAPPPAVLIQAD